MEKTAAPRTAAPFLGIADLISSPHTSCKFKPRSPSVRTDQLTKSWRSLRNQGKAELLGFDIFYIIYNLHNIYLGLCISLISSQVIFFLVINQWEKIMCPKYASDLSKSFKIMIN